MRRLLPILCLTLAVLLGSAGEGWSANYQKGQEAFLKKDFATTLREWTPLAERGNTDAQFNLGQMYYYGRGVPRDYKTAVKWYRLAAKQGYAKAQKNLGILEKEIAKLKIQTKDKKSISLSLEELENKCTELGFTKGTEKHGDCVMKLYK